MGRRQHQSFRGNKNPGNSCDIDHKKINSGDIAISAQSFPPKQVDSTSPRDGRGVGERSTAHWQPKSQAFSGSDQLSVQPDGSVQNSNVEVFRGKKNESGSQSGMLLPSQHMETGDVNAQPHHDHHGSVKSSVEEAAPDVKYQEVNREKNMASEPPSGGTDIRYEHRPFSGFRKNGNQNSRYGRRHDSRGDWSSGGQVYRQHNQPANRERQRQSAHYEYQPVGPYNNKNTSGNVEGPNSGSHIMDGRYRERGRRNSRHGGGNFYGRQTDSVGVDAVHE